MVSGHQVETLRKDWAFRYGIDGAIRLRDIRSILVRKCNEPSSTWEASIYAPVWDAMNAVSFGRCGLLPVDLVGFERKVPQLEMLMV